MDTINTVEIIFDPAKSNANARRRGLPFSVARDGFDWTAAQVVEDTRRDYGERRYRAIGYIGERLHALVYAPRAGALRIISLRKANRREERRYATQTETATE